MKKIAIFGLTLVFTFFVGSAVQAQRVGNFEFSAQPVNKETSHVTGQGSYWIDKQKNQNMVYKVRIDYKGLDLLENVTIFYVTSSTGSPKNQSTEGTEKFEKITSQQKIEFETKGIENTYMHYSYDGGSYKAGKAQLRGVAIRIMQGETLLAEWAQPADMKSLWNK